MKKSVRMHRSKLQSVECSEGITIETMVEKILNNQNNDETEKKQMYTERRDGVLAGTDIRSDRWDIAIDAMDKSSKSQTAKRQAKMNVVKTEEDGKADGVQGTENK